MQSVLKYVKRSYIRTFNRAPTVCRTVGTRAVPTGAAREDGAVESGAA